MVEKKQKQIIVEQVVVTGYIKHVNGRKSPFAYNKKDFEPKAFEKIFEELGRKYE
jgi:hypothetical protein